MDQCPQSQPAAHLGQCHPTRDCLIVTENTLVCVVCEACCLASGLAPGRGGEWRCGQHCVLSGPETGKSRSLADISSSSETSPPHPAIPCQRGHLPHREADLLVGTVALGERDSVHLSVPPSLLNHLHRTQVTAHNHLLPEPELRVSRPGVERGGSAGPGHLQPLCPHPFSSSIHLHPSHLPPGI